MNEAQKKFWKTFAINSLLTFAGVTSILALSDYKEIKAQAKIKPKTT